MSVTSLVLRLAVHLYQGRLAFISILPLAVVFTVYYSRTNRLWPVIVAHMLFDIIALASVVRPERERWCQQPSLLSQ